MVIIMSQNPKKSASNNVRLFDQLTSWNLELRDLIEDLKTPAQAPDDQSTSPESIKDRLNRLGSLVVIEQSLLQRPTDHLVFYCAAAYRSLTDAFVMTQRHAALRRISTSDNPEAQAIIAEHSQVGRWISVGISHLTTSRQHVREPSVLARRSLNGWTVSGTVPWVTAASCSDALVIAACDSEEFSKQYLFYLPMNSNKVICGPSMELMALSASGTAQVDLLGVELTPSELLHGPCENVLTASHGSGAGGLQTTALALGLAARVIDAIQEKCKWIPDLAVFEDSFCTRWQELFERMKLASVTAGTQVDQGELRKDANDLVLRVSQASLAIDKGAGYLANSLASKWVRESMFFLVWSCPQTIATKHLCDLSRFETAINLGG